MNLPLPAERRLWFLNALVLIRVSYEDGADGLSILEHRAPHDDSPPLHVHRTEDEIFHVLDGELLLRIADKELHARPGEILLAPRGVPHTYRVETASARWLTITGGRDFERFVRSISRVAIRDGLPEPSGPPTPEEVRALEEACRRHDIVLVGPPLHRERPDASRIFGAGAR
jgi:quercetin dioxygenase-like cupin family protein